MDKNTILDYATNSPENTNRNVLGSMLDQFAQSSGSGGTSAVLLYTVPSANTDPAMEQFLNVESWQPEDDGGLSLEPQGTPLTYSELSALFSTNPYVLVVDWEDSFYPYSVCIANTLIVNPIDTETAIIRALAKTANGFYGVWFDATGK